MNDKKKTKRVGADAPAGGVEESPVRGFFRLTDLTAGGAPRPRLYTGPVVEIEYGLFYLNGGTAGEILVAWERTGGRETLTPRISAYGDGFTALWQLRGVLRALSRKPGITPEDFCRLLSRKGFTDLTLKETAWVAHEASGSFFRLRDYVLETAPMSADSRAREPRSEEVVTVDYDEAARCGETDLDELRAIETALRRGATSFDELDRYKGRAKKRGGRS